MKLSFKKISVLVVFLFLSFCTQVFASTTSDSFQRKFIGSYSYVDSNGHHGNFEHFTRTSDGKTSFCIEPGVSFYTGSYTGYSDSSLEELASAVSLTKDVLNKISLYAYFGYGYDGHTGNAWIVATQAKIWEALGNKFDFTSRYDKPNDKIDVPSEIQSNMNTLENLVNAYQKMPTFSNTHPKIAYKKSYNYGNINGFSVTNCENCTYSISEGDLIVTPTSKKSGRVTLEKSALYYDGNFIVYASNNGQNLMIPGNITPLQTSVEFDVVSGKLKLKKYDQDNKSCKPKEGGSLKGSVYKLYKEDNTYVGDSEIDEDCSASIGDLELGTYYVKEAKPGLNYELDKNTYTFTLTMDHSTKELTVYDKMYLGQIKIRKWDADTKSCTPTSIYASLNGAKYGLYKKDGTLLDTLVIGSDCSVLSKRNLLLGEYYIQEIEAPKGYQLDKKKHTFSITKENADGVVEIKVTDKIYKAKIVLNKNYLYYTTTKPEVGAEFVILYKKNKEVVKRFKIGNDGFASVILPYGEYIIKQKSGQAGYHFVEDITFVVDENTKETTYMTLLNRPYRGTLLFTKIDIETGEVLPNVLIEVYNEEEELMYRGITDENGQIVVENLPYGNYYILEKKALEGYQLFTEPIYFSIQEDEEIVEVSMENVKIVQVPDTKKDAYGNYVFLTICLVPIIGKIRYEEETI